MFITFEGIDGSGKSTQITLLSGWLKSLGNTVLVLREPGGNALSENIRNILLNTNEQVDIRCELLLFAAARAQLVSKIIKPALDENTIVLCDRYIDSSVAYQGYGRGLSIQDVESINTFATNDLVPDITFVFDLDPTEAANRADDRSDKTSTASDRMERSGIDFFDKVRNGYLDIAKRSDGRVFVLNAKDTIDQLQNSIRSAVQSQL